MTMIKPQTIQIYLPNDSPTIIGKTGRILIQVESLAEMFMKE